MDNAVITLRAFEPAGSVLNIGASELVRHILGVGSTGSGKTTALVNPILQQVIAYGSGERRMGLLILDGKGDETVDKVMQFARETGRENDVLVLGGDSDCRYDFFEGLSRLDQVDEYTGRLLSGSRSMGVENAYWTEARVGLVNTALTILLASESKVTFEAWSEFGRAWWFGGDYALVNSRVDFVTKLLDLGKLDARTQRRLELAVLEVKNWQNLDNRTREIQRSTLGMHCAHYFLPAVQRISWIQSRRCSTRAPCWREKSWWLRVVRPSNHYWPPCCSRCSSGTSMMRLSVGGASGLSRTGCAG
jgi:hypothetical protein